MNYNLFKFSKPKNVKKKRESVEDKTYKTNLVFDLPINELVGQKETHTEIKDFSKTIYKRL